MARGPAYLDGYRAGLTEAARLAHMWGNTSASRGMRLPDAGAAERCLLVADALRHLALSYLALRDEPWWRPDLGASDETPTAEIAQGPQKNSGAEEPPSDDADSSPPGSAA